MRVLLTDDQNTMRLALRRLLEQEPELHVVGEVAEVDDLLTQVRETRPDLVLLNWELPGIQADHIQHVRRGYPLRVVAFSENCAARQAALAAGADAFVSREEPVKGLLTTLRTVMGLSPWVLG